MERIERFCRWGRVAAELREIKRLIKDRRARRRRQREGQGSGEGRGGERILCSSGKHRERSFESCQLYKIQKGIGCSPPSNFISLPTASGDYTKQPERVYYISDATCTCKHQDFQDSERHEGLIWPWLQTQRRGRNDMKTRSRKRKLIEKTNKRKQRSSYRG